MRALRNLAVLAIAILAAFIAPATAHAADSIIVSQPFAADSGDSCRYDVTDGTLNWRYATSPVRVVAIDVSGRLIDRPTVNSLCADDHYLSTAIFTAYAGNTVVDRQTRRADNAIVSFNFTLASSSTVAQLDRVVVQVCRQPVNSLPVIYCGTPQEYRAPVVSGLAP